MLFNYATNNYMDKKRHLLQRDEVFGHFWYTPCGLVASRNAFSFVQKPQMFAFFNKITLEYLTSISLM